jgi:anti-anti-sigma factor
MTALRAKTSALVQEDPRDRDGGGAFSDILRTDARMIRSPTREAERALKIRTRKTPECVLIELHGRLESPLDRELLREIESLIDLGTTRVVVDCSGLDYMSSHGVSVFIAVLDDVRQANGDLKLVGVARQAAVVLDRLGVPAVIQRFATLDEAVKAFDVPIREFLYGRGPNPWIASSGGAVYHSSDCGLARRIRNPKPFASQADARRAGLRACRRCASD